MNYIPADKLIELVKEWRNKQMGFAWDAVNEVVKIIDSLQQEQPEVDLTDDASFNKELRRYLSETGSEKERAEQFCQLSNTSTNLDLTQEKNE